MKNRIIYSFLVFLGMIISINTGNATHVAGGNLHYECLGDNQYRVTLEFRRDCFNGNPLAQFDSEASIGIFDINGTPIIKSDGGQVLIEFSDSDTLNQIFTSECAIQGDDVCVEMTTYTKVITLPYNATGYILAYQRCCRNISLNNIIDPLNQGSTYWTTISEKAQTECNSAPRFNEWPDIYICANEDLIFDHSATDMDGDSLVYKLCAPSVGASQAISQPQPPGPPPYDTVVWNPPYDLSNMMGGVALNIDPNTGLLTANPNLVGQFLIGICVEEYRDGELLGFTRRDFEYNVRICDPHPVVTITPESDFNCEELSGSFSVEVEPSNSTYQWFMINGADTSYFGQIPDININFPEAGLYTVGVSAQDGTCVDTAFQSFYVATDGFENIEITDPGVVCSDTITLSASADLGATFEWFTDSALTTSIGTGSTIMTELVGGNQTFYVVQTDSPCTEVDSITVQGFLPDVTIDTPPDMDLCLGGEYVITVTNNNPATTLTYVWGGDATLTTAQGLSEATFDFPGPGSYMITLQITDESSGCVINYNYPVNIFMSMPDVDIMVPADDFICDDGEYTLSIVNNNTSSPLSVIWGGDGTLVTTQGLPTASFTFPGPGMYVVTLQIEDSSGCRTFNEYPITVIESPVDLDLDAILTPCYGDDVILNPSGDADLIYNWSSDITDWITDPSATSPIIEDVTEAGTVFVDVYVDGFPECTESYEVLVNPLDSILIDITGQTSFCEIAELDLHAQANQPGEITWTNLTNGNTVTGDTYTETITESTDIQVIFIGDNGCEMMLVVPITVQIPSDLSISSSTGDIFCDGETVTLEAIYDGNGTVTWSDEDFMVIGTGDQIVVNPVGETTYNVTVESGDCIVSSSITLTPSELTMSLDYPTIICMDGDLIIDITTSSSSPVSYTYNFTEDVTVISDDQISILTDGDVSGTIVALNEDGCEVTAAVDVLYDGIDGFEVFADPDTIIIEETTELSTNGDGDWDYSWSPAETLDDATSSNPLATPVDSTTIYMVTVTNDNGCTATDEISVTTRFPQCNSEDVYVPNLFTPNGDNLNDIFRPESNYIDEMNLVIYDRWGEKVFETSVLGSGWDGTFDGAPLDPDVYGYCLNVVCVNGTEYTTQGNVTLMK